jgi:hypothetical protein
VQHGNETEGDFRPDFPASLEPPAAGTVLAGRKEENFRFRCALVYNLLEMR